MNAYEKATMESLALAVKDLLAIVRRENAFTIPKDEDAQAMDHASAALENLEHLEKGGV